MGTLDRRLRLFILAPILVIAGVIVGPTSILAIVLYVLAAVMVGTSLAGSCPLYTLFGIQTCPKQTFTTADEGGVAR
ncbi:YgaP family membrane protein [Aeromicrobium flavum]|nr:DUF2892 domain-containing protein [Aeromicrobium flavum]